MSQADGHAGGSEFQSGLVEALQTVAKQLQVISERLPSTVSADSLSNRSSTASDRDSGDLSHVNASAYKDDDVPASSGEHDKHEDKDNEDQTLVEEQEQLWSATKSDLQEQSKTNIEGWKDEMNNLLIFAGLFSAVVTAFTVESYKWLQPTPDDNSDLYLAHISRQLSSFVVSPTIINSSTSAAALPPEGAQSFFTPIAVPVNTLWVLSLTLSLLSAFFAIAVQQWLRQQRVPPDIPVRKAVQLLSLRYRSLQSWQVPGIISLLPLLLQSAVVLFLAGLFLLLRILNRTVTAAFVTVAAIGLLAFLVTTIVPLVNYSCPYKSPLLPTILLILEWFLKIFPILLFILGYPFMAFLRSDIGTKLLYLFRIWIQYHTYLDEPYSSLVHWIKTFEVVDVTRFWTTREHLYLSSLDELGIKDLENRSIAHVFISTGSNKFANITRGLRTFNYQEWHSIVCRAIVQSINVVLPNVEWKDIIGGGPPVLQPRVRPYLRWMSFRHHRLLWRLLQQRDWTEDDAVSQTDGEVLTLFHDLDSTVSDTQHTLKSASLIPDTQHVYLKYLLGVCDKQRFASSWQCFSYETIPGCLTLHLTQSYGNTLDKEDVLCIQRYFDKCLLFSQSLRRKADKNTVKLFLAAATSVLTLANSTFHVTLDGVSQILRELDDFITNPPSPLTRSSFTFEPLSDEALLIRSMLRSQHEDADEDSRGDYMSAPLIVRNLCNALEGLASSRRVLRDPDCRSLSVTRTLHAVLSEIGANDAMLARQHLSEFERFVPHGGDIEVWRKQAKKDEDLDNILEQGMLAQLLAERQEASLGRMQESEPLNALMEQVVEAQISAEKREVRREEALHAELPDAVLAQVIEAQVSAEKREARRGRTIQAQLSDTPLEEGIEALMLASQREDGHIDQEGPATIPDADDPRSHSPFAQDGEASEVTRDAHLEIQPQIGAEIPSDKLFHDLNGEFGHGETVGLPTDTSGGADPAQGKTGETLHAAEDTPFNGVAAPMSPKNSPEDGAVASISPTGSPDGIPVDLDGQRNGGLADGKKYD